jgi:hypothetical protein
MMISLCLISPFAQGDDQCDLTIVRAQESSRSSALEYDVFNRDGLVKHFDVYVRRNDKAISPCEALIRIQTRGPIKLINSGGNAINFRLQPLQKSSSYQQGKVLLLPQSITHGQVLKFSYQVLLEGEQFVAPGFYHHKLWIEVASAEQVASDFFERINLNLTATVAPAARISFAGTLGRSQNVDFGELSDGITISPQPVVIIQSTGRFALRFSSLHQGSLRHKSGQEKWDIPYKSALGTRKLTLSEKSITLRYDQPTPSLGLRLPLRLSVPKVGKKPAGNYNDVINVVIFPSELLVK